MTGQGQIGNPDNSTSDSSTWDTSTASSVKSSVHKSGVQKACGQKVVRNRTLLGSFPLFYKLSQSLNSLNNTSSVRSEAENELDAAIKSEVIGEEKSVVYSPGILAYEKALKAQQQSTTASIKASSIARSR